MWEDKLFSEKYGSERFKDQIYKVSNSELQYIISSKLFGM
jgi:hypothetical protein